MSDRPCIADVLTRVNDLVAPRHRPLQRLPSQHPGELADLRMWIWDGPTRHRATRPVASRPTRATDETWTVELPSLDDALVLRRRAEIRQLVSG
ncbi:MAG: hypothetical protein ACI8PZ_007518 [Myxococcota bacterium]|jgi:hypothetical protein